jgi:hypothetical protein
MKAIAQRIICSSLMSRCNLVKGDVLLEWLTEQAELAYSNYILGVGYGPSH